MSSGQKIEKQLVETSELHHKEETHSFFWVLLVVALSMRRTV